MGILTFLALLPLLDIWGFIVIGPHLGLSGTLLVVIASTLFGFSLLRTEGVATAFRVSELLRRGGSPIPTALDGTLRMVAGLLFIWPGFVSDALGLLLLLPPVRTLAVTSLLRRMTSGPTMPSGAPRAGGSVIEGEFHEIPPEAPHLPREPRP